MNRIECTADQLLAALLDISRTEPIAVLDSCGDSYLDSHLLIAGLEPVKTIQISGECPDNTLRTLEAETVSGNAVFFTLSYEFGSRLAGVKSKKPSDPTEPDLFVAIHDALVVHDYRDGSTWLVGDRLACDRIRNRILQAIRKNLDSVGASREGEEGRTGLLTSSLTKTAYLDAVAAVQELIRKGETYQTNFTHQLRFELSDGPFCSQEIFKHVRRDSPAAFAAFLARSNSTVISVSPERFFRIEGSRISASPIKGTRRRSSNLGDDEALRQELLASSKDRAENTMIVDLVRNDLGRICEYGSILVEKLCEIEKHRTLYHLVSTISGQLCAGISLSEIFRALFPCGSITGAPKISTMRIIDELESHARGLSMGTIGYAVPEGWLGSERIIDTSVAIRTLVMRDGVGEFSVGGGIVIDSVAEQEYAETLTKAEALRSALNGRFDF